MIEQINLGNMANGNLQSVIDHGIVKTFTPLAVAALLGTVGWLFSTVMDVEKLALENSTHVKHIHMAEETFEKQIEDMNKTLTDIRINVGRLVH